VKVNVLTGQILRPRHSVFGYVLRSRLTDALSKRGYQIGKFIARALLESPFRQGCLGIIKILRALTSPIIAAYKVWIDPPRRQYTFDLPQQV